MKATLTSKPTGAARFNLKAFAHADPPARKAIDSRATREPLRAYQNGERESPLAFASICHHLLIETQRKAHESARTVHGWCTSYLPDPQQANNKQTARLGQAKGRLEILVHKACELFVSY